MPLWSFSANVEPRRASELLAIADFEQVLRLLEAATVVSFRWKAFESDRLRGCHRAEYTLCVEEETYDAIFNAPVGLRAQYARSPSHGEAASRRVIGQLTPRLLSYSADHPRPPRADVEWSLSGAQAKIWIDEEEAETQLGQVESQIVYQPWEAHSETGVGLLAPRASRLEVKGGWLDPSGTVVLDPCKARRSEDIHLEGYS